MSHERILKNRANLNNLKEPGQDAWCENCDERLIFSLRDDHHEFSLGMRTILECLKFAEEQGEIPKIPRKWWNKISVRHGIISRE
ncbi:hypothetical protein [Desulforhopalus singaporensis]|uniref:Uncharacterized protein n=1 Tax=Desulforhopalus singaporensis TaxID=91360 RepID=A0A1H0P9K6_9BACT|nr:hypothetical protein [Desulforhopalus singaporensis]SDP01787.1 hypothetical protein SAMN05660330_01576 [Desulforhopalus singaporensis]